jgi:3-dehydroquinate synthase
VTRNRAKAPTEPAPREVVVSHALGTYPVYVSSGVLSQLDDILARHLPARRLLLIADDGVDKLLRNGRLAGFAWKGDRLTFAAGEQSKSRESWARLTDALLERRYGRDSGIVAVGGGVTGDLAGFVAATYLRGIPYIQVPTTLLAMVDASVGGKTGVNTPAGKNLVGAFYPPAAVVADPQVLTTLPDSAYRGGLAEAVKHGLIADADYFTWIEANVPTLLNREPETLTHLVRRSVEIKAQVVGTDEREQGRRAILNAGHTVAHALEQISGYRLPHGDAVALGLVTECVLGEQLGVTPPGLSERLKLLLGRLGLPTRSSAPLERDALMAAMSSDKKNRERTLRFAFVAAVGRMHDADGWTTAADAAAVRNAVAAIE